MASSSDFALREHEWGEQLADASDASDPSGGTIPNKDAQRRGVGGGI